MNGEHSIESFNGLLSVTRYRKFSVTVVIPAVMKTKVTKDGRITAVTITLFSEKNCLVVMRSPSCITCYTASSVHIMNICGGCVYLPCIGIANEITEVL